MINYSVVKPIVGQQPMVPIFVDSSHHVPNSTLNSIQTHIKQENLMYSNIIPENAPCNDQQTYVLDSRNVSCDNYRVNEAQYHLTQKKEIQKGVNEKCKNKRNDTSLRYIQDQAASYPSPLRGVNKTMNHNFQESRAHISLVKNGNLPVQQSQLDTKQLDSKETINSSTLLETKHENNIVSSAGTNPTRVLSEDSKTFADD